MNLTDRAGSDRSVNYRRSHAHRCPADVARARGRRTQAGRPRAVRDGRIRRDLPAAHRRPGRLLQVERALPLRARRRRCSRRPSSRRSREFEVVLGDFLAGRGSGRRRLLVDRIVDLLLEYRQAVHVFLIQGPSLSDLPIIARANAAVRKLAAAISEERESVADQVRFGIALGGAAFLLTAGRTFADDDHLPADDELRGHPARRARRPARPGRPPSDPHHRLRDIPWPSSSIASGDSPSGGPGSSSPPGRSPSPPSSAPASASAASSRSRSPSPAPSRRRRSTSSRPSSRRPRARP